MTNSKRLLLVALCLALALPAAAQDRTLVWDEIAVTARLDAAGKLHVRERQAILFDGDWNGGERSFLQRVNQDLDLQRIARVDANGREIPLVEGDTESVDHYDWSGSTVRWRSRLPSDPPFDQTRITYVLDYTLSGILIRDGDVYRFDHNFGLPDVEYPIRHFVLDLELDPAWQPLAAVPAHLEERDLPPGSDVLVTSDLRHKGGAASPKPGLSIVPILWRRAAFAAALLAMLALYVLFRQAEARRGRFEPLPGPRDWDEAWLRENVLDLRPEEVGALWDRQTGAPEVAAVLARMVAEGKLESWVTPGFNFFGIAFSPGVLHLRLKVQRFQIAGYELKLVDKLFLGADETDTKRVRQHYKSTGFDPSKVIADDLESRLGQRLGAVLPPSRRRTQILWLAALALFALDAIRHPLSTAILAGIMAFGLIFPWIGGGIAAHSWRNRTERLDLGSLWFLVPGLLVFLWCAFLVFNREWLGWNTGLVPGLPGVLALALVPLAVWSSLLNNARSRESDEGIRKRRLLGAGRRLLRRELKSAHPRLHDEWLPYLLAFGLGGEMDRWFRAFGGASRDGSTFTSTSTGGSFGSSGSSGWSGGGGQFGGAGAMASWSMAAAGMASGVSAPSSSSSGGGGGGGSSGGGGGGGW
ncbi:MAG TPA: DUF2207 domain-containing protein [Thermoanaerobaculia bacterium]|jgi:uncharacterized membrane protein YgcG|nr:DUF2207 domain-containing protein [Thermoanaerobaculia bacterium]